MTRRDKIIVALYSIAICGAIVALALKFLT